MLSHRRIFSPRLSLAAGSAVAVLLLSDLPAQAVFYNAVVLTNSSFPGAQGLALNDNNQVTGYYYDHIGNGHYEQPFVYNFSTNTFSALPGFANTSNYLPSGINNSGLIVGSDTTTNNGFVDNAGAVTEVSPLAGSTLTFSGVNSNGLAVGTSTTATTGVTRAVVYNSTSKTLSDVGSGFSGPASAGFSNTGYGINASGQVEGLGVDTGGSSTAVNTNAIPQPFIATPAGGSSYTYKNVGNVIDPTDSSTYSQFAGGIDAQGNLTGSVNGGGSNNNTAYFFNASTASYATIAGNPSNGNVIADVNGAPWVVGNYYPFVRDSTGSLTHSQGFPMYLYQSGTITDLYNFSPGGVTLQAGSLAINSVGSILASGNSATAGPVTVLLTIDNTQVVYTGASSNSWDTTSANFSPANYADGDLVVFNDSATGSTVVAIPSTVTPQAVTFNNSSKSYVLSGAGVAGAGTYLNVAGKGQVTLNNVNTFTGATNVSAGSLIIGSTGSIASGVVSVSAGASLNVQNSIGLAASQTQPPSLSLSVGGTVLLQNYGSGAPTVFGVSGLSISGSTDHWTGKLDLVNNDMVAYRGSLSQITNQVKSGYAGGTWQGNGITSSAAASDTSHLTALGVIQDTADDTTNGIALYSSFHGTAVYSNYVLLGYTYYGDANLDGQVDSSDYTLIDGAYLNNQNTSSPQLTGWYNGDFNYDGVINGSDYTLIDNAFNAQGSNLGGGTNDTEIARVTAQISGTAGISAVPEPATFSLLSVAVLGALRRRPRARRRVSDGHLVA